MCPYAGQAKRLFCKATLCNKIEMKMQTTTAQTINTTQQQLNHYSIAGYKKEKPPSIKLMEVLKDERKQMTNAFMRNRLFIQCIEQEFKGAMCLSTECNLRTESIKHPLAYRRRKSRNAVF